MKRKLAMKQIKKKKKVLPVSVDVKVDEDNDEDVCPAFEDVAEAYKLLVSNVKSGKQIVARSSHSGGVNEDIGNSGSDQESDVEDVNLSGSEEAVEDIDEVDDSADTPSSDPFKMRYECMLAEDVVERMAAGTMARKTSNECSLGGREFFSYDSYSSSDIESDDLSNANLSQANMKEKLRARFTEVNKPKGSTASGELTELQRTLYRDVSAYRDVFYHDRNFENAEEIRRMYCLHAVNHIWKTRSRIVKNNTKLAEQQSAEGPTSMDEDSLRDQGLTRPKVLIIVPFRDACLKIVNLIIKLASISGTKSQIMQKKRFKTEYSSASDDRSSKAAFLPDDHKKMFSGNVDDCFRMGVGLTRGGMKLFADFYHSDVIVASPLGLRMLIGTEGEKKRDFDFLSSIELLIVDQADVFHMQNTEHVYDVFEHLHRTPKEHHGVDFSRVRMWSVNEWSRFYRQTLLFSSLQTPLMNSLFNRHCHNYAGKVRLTPQTPLAGSVRQVVVAVPQTFHRFECAVHAEDADRRFNYFVDVVLPRCRNTAVNTVVYVPSYFDFVRLRNHLKKEGVPFTSISEYSKRAHISRARSEFLDGRKSLMLFTERFYFFFRYRIRGGRNLVFYGLPIYPHFYPEIVNFIDAGAGTQAGELNRSPASCSVLYSRFEGHKLENVLGTERARKMLTSTKNTHIVMTGE